MLRDTADHTSLSYPVQLQRCACAVPAANNSRSISTRLRGGATAGSPLHTARVSSKRGKWQAGRKQAAGWLLAKHRCTDQHKKITTCIREGLGARSGFCPTVAAEAQQLKQWPSFPSLDQSRHQKFPHNECQHENHRIPCWLSTGRPEERSL